MNEELLLFETSASKKREFPSEEIDLNISSNNNSLDSGIQDLNSSSLSSSSSSSTNQSHDLNISSANNSAEFELDYNNEQQQHNQVLDNNNNKVTLFQQQHQQQQSEYLSSVDHPHTLNNKSLFSYYFYTNTNTVLNRLVMSYEEQLHKAIVKANFELARELVEERRCDVNAAASKRLPLGLAAEYNILPIVQLLIKVHTYNKSSFFYIFIIKLICLLIKILSFLSSHFFFIDCYLKKLVVNQDLYDIFYLGLNYYMYFLSDFYLKLREFSSNMKLFLSWFSIF